MQMSKKWHWKIVNQDIPFLVIVSAQTLAILRKIELHTANNSSVHLKTL